MQKKHDKVPEDKSEDAAGLMPGKDDNAVFIYFRL